MFFSRVCCVLCAVCCVLCAVCCMLCADTSSFIPSSLKRKGKNTTTKQAISAFRNRTQTTDIWTPTETVERHQGGFFPSNAPKSKMIPWSRDPVIPWFRLRAFRSVPFLTLTWWLKTVKNKKQKKTQATGIRQQATGNRQQATGNRQQATGWKKGSDANENCKCQIR